MSKTSEIHKISYYISIINLVFILVGCNKNEISSDFEETITNITGTNSYTIEKFEDESEVVVNIKDINTSLLDSSDFKQTALIILYDLHLELEDKEYNNFIIHFETKSDIYKLDYNLEKLIFSRATLAYNKEDYNKAINILSHGVKTFPSNPQFYTQRGYIYAINTDNYDSALFDFRKALEFESSKADNLRLMAMTFIRSGNLDSAYKYLKKSNKLNPNDAATNQELGLYFYKTSNIDSSKYHLEKSLDIDPKNNDLYLVLGNIELERGELNSAKNYTEKYINKTNDLYTGSYILGRILIELNDMESACKQLNISRNQGNIESDSLYQVYCN
ncbi:hypothetical protein OO013_07970 [Mangrovivirga sp. M17]|uniref:Tetratricopeptide repeat protein n=1 Tax=Mangrovivirga halotolerans TaxID=2993936 RepID=A0ABT3RRA3_9BACT|nr:hypothetical protein [Mangrovivirga halotolerans]MCX2743797.1 hypothetical protein [Mangrovivirga halotolerans]